MLKQYIRYFTDREQNFYGIISGELELGEKLPSTSFGEIQFKIPPILYIP
jgi:hypothetical protein